MKLNNIIIRRALLNDIEAIAEIKAEGWKIAYKGIIDDEALISISPAQQTETYKSYSLENMFVAEKDGEIFGFCRVYDYDSPVYEDTEIDCEIREIYVKPNMKRMGIGSELFCYTLNHFKQKGRKKLCLGCFKENTDSRRFYEKMGGVVGEGKDINVFGKNYRTVSYVYNLI